MRNLLILLLAAMLGGCATTGGRASLDSRDPYEGFNRNVWAFNDAVDTVAIKPVTTVYRTVTPVPARRGISRVFANLTEPFSFVNNLLQGKPGRALNSLGRFLINTTIGVGGLADHATGLGLPATPEDFGQTLAVHGAKKSPYLVLPLLGPSTVRDAVGTAVRFVADPAQIAIGSELTRTQSLGVTGGRLIDARSQAIDSGADTLLKTSADPYAVARSAYLQSREAAIRDADTGASDDLMEDGQDQLLEKALEEDRPDAPDGGQPETPPAEPETGPTEPLV
jgi:phospholipid-binding lipoprotein MlaA